MNINKKSNIANLLILIIFCIFLNLNDANANLFYSAKIDRLAKELDQKLKLMNDALIESSNSEVIEKENGQPLMCKSEIFFFNSLWVRFGLEFSIKIPLATFKITPYLGFIWGRKNPEGWKVYQP